MSSFDYTLKTLRDAARYGERGVRSDRVTVNRRHLEELIEQFDRLDNKDREERHDPRTCPTKP